MENRLTRRDALGAGAGAAATLFGFAVKDRLSPQDSPPPETNLKEPKQQVYRSGETIEDPATPITIDGWQLLFDDEMLKSYTKAGEKNVNFSLFVPQSLGPVRQVWGGGGSYISQEADEKGKVYRRMPALPPDKGEVYLRFTEKDRLGDVTREGIYIINLQSYTYEATRRGLFDPKIFSEIPLDQSQFKEVFEHAKMLKNFLPDSPRIYILKHREGLQRSGYHAREERYEALMSIKLTEPLYPNEALMSLDHELSHGIMDSIMQDSADQRVNVQIWQAYEEVLKEAGFKVPMPVPKLLPPPREALNLPTFAIFREGSYTQEKYGLEADGMHGHPYTNSTELFASGLTVLRFFPNEFINRFTKLTPSQKKAVRAAFHAFLAVLEDQAKTPEIEKAIQTLLPQIDELREKVG